MKVESIPSSTVKTFSSGTMALCLDEGYPRHGFRLKRRTSAMSSTSKHAADTTMGCGQLYRKATRRRTDCYEFVPRTPRAMKSTAIPPKLRLPSLDDDGNHAMPMICPRYGTNSLDCSSVSVALNGIFDAAATISDDDCSENTFLSENLFLPLLEN